MPQPLTALSRRCIVNPRPLQMGPSYPHVVLDREIGGPEDPADRRLILDARTLEALLDIARRSTTQRVVLHHIGLRVQTLEDRENGHRWDHCTLIGSEPKPEPAPLNIEV